jgi:hypothetical protein
MRPKYLEQALLTDTILIITQTWLENYMVLTSNIFHINILAKMLGKEKRKDTA